MLAARYHWGLDLTKEKRFTLTPATKQLLKNMDDVAVVEVYLQGDKLPAGFQKLSEGTREILRSLKEQANGSIVYSIFDPVEGKDPETRDKIYTQLAEKGVYPVNLQVTSQDEGYSEKYVLPYALVKYKGREMPVKLLENNVAFSPKENLNFSESLLEYKFANAINKLQSPTRPEIAYIMGHDETLSMNTYDLLTTLNGMYKVDTIDLVNSVYIPRYYKAIIINQPKMPFDDKEKFKIDQYIMNGGNVLWAIDVLNTPMDSLQRSQQFITMDYGLNLDDQLFKYGVRINSDLIEDMQCLPIPVKVGVGADNSPQMQLRNWIYFPLFIPSSSHAIVKNMDGVMGKFVSSIDTIANPEVKKTILLQSSKYSRTTASPARVSLSMLNYPLRPEMFTKGNQPVAVLLEGKFKSIFENRLASSFLQILKDSLKMEYRAAADTEGKMIVIADGDMLENDFTNSQGPMEMGYWQFTRDRFANKAFVLNCVEYLTDKSGLLEARSKEVRLRLLDAARVKNEKNTWRIVNIAVPIAIVLVFASCYLFFRKRKYETKMIDNKK
jgi:gliding-associated putative ABC transporter substrate-binding component GldG